MDFCHKDSVKDTFFYNLGSKKLIHGNNIILKITFKHKCASGLIIYQGQTTPTVLDDGYNEYKNVSACRRHILLGYHKAISCICCGLHNIDRITELFEAPSYHFIKLCFVTCFVFLLFIVFLFIVCFMSISSLIGSI